MWVIRGLPRIGYTKEIYGPSKQAGTERVPAENAAYTVSELKKHFGNQPLWQCTRRLFSSLIPTAAKGRTSAFGKEQRNLILSITEQRFQTRSSPSSDQFSSLCHQYYTQSCVFEQYYCLYLGVCDSDLVSFFLMRYATE